MTKVKAFTVMELLVVAILSVLIAGSAFSVIRILNQQYNDYENDHRISAEIDELYSWMQWDCYSANRMKIQDGSLVFEYPAKDILYKIEKGGISRVLSPLNKILLKNSLQHSTIITFLKKEEKEEGLVDYVQLNFLLFGKKTQLTLRKQYSAKELITIYAD